jgi:hypothetical protein
MVHKLTRPGLALLAGAALVLAGCASGSSATGASGASSASSSTAARTTRRAAPSGAINDLCPMSGIPINPRIPTVEYAGHKIAFCSTRCAPAWETLPKAKKDRFVAKYNK